jgi:thiamine biosynthesis lipoprotein
MMGGLTLLWMLGVGLPTAPPREPELKRFQFDRVEMAVPFQLVLYAPDSATANESAEAAFARIRQLNHIFSDYDPESETRRLCDTAGEGKYVPVSAELWDVLCRARGISRRSGGAFDVTVGPIVLLWRRARRQRELPDPAKLAQARQRVGYELVRLDPQRRAVELTKRGMRLDFGGIAKGYAVDQAMAVLRQHGVTRAMVHAGGDIGLGEPPPDAPGWRVAIPSLDINRPPQTILSLSRCAVATSGDTWQFVVIEGRRYSHVVDPRTGIGLTDHCQVTVVVPGGASADGLATAVSVLGPEKGLRLIEETPGAAALVLRAPQGKTEVFQSSRWKELRVVPARDGGPERGIGD